MVQNDRTARGWRYPCGSGDIFQFILAPVSRAQSLERRPASDAPLDAVLAARQVKVSVNVQGELVNGLRGNGGRAGVTDRTSRLRLIVLRFSGINERRSE